MADDFEEQQERRKHSGLTDAEIEKIKEHILASVYEDIGRSLVKKAIWVLGAVFATLFAWLAAKGYINPK